MDSWVAKYWHKLFSENEQEAPEDSIHGQSEILPLDSEDVANAAGEGGASGFQEKKDDYSDGSGPSGVSFGRGGRSRQLSLRGYFVKPLCCLEICTLYRKRAGMEEYYVYNSVQSQITLGLRPLLVTDGSLIITSARNSFNDNAQIESESKQNIETAPPRTRAVPSGRGGAFHSQGCDLFSGFDDSLAFDIYFCVHVFFLFLYHVKLSLISA